MRQKLNKMVVLAITVITLMLVQPVFASTQLSIIDLGNLGGADSIALGINARGQVVGWSSARVGSYAFLWEKTTMTNLGTLPGGSFSAAQGVNERGQVVGRNYTTTNNILAFLWENGTMTDLGTLPGGSFSSAWAINNSGQIVGYADIASGDQHAFLWENGAMTDLGTLGSSFS